ncbi:hypothetical protein HPB50_010821 [Hyalomma asiaticum]|uniref:Uncharacterized protein n=1 Tax=Hyalomma asiaticum TaxID=266040 RepID=A0ACB7T7L9_HYAAI|nr:hypothetical protein HPB50_010821 [Hyalomma asiaticum]
MVAMEATFAIGVTERKSQDAVPRISHVSPGRNTIVDCDRASIPAASSDSDLPRVPRTCHVVLPTLPSARDRTLPPTTTPLSSAVPRESASQVRGQMDGATFPRLRKVRASDYKRQDVIT